MAEEKKPAKAFADETAPKKKRVNVIELRSPYRFEGVEYTEVDVSGLDTMTINDAVRVQHRLFDEREIAASTLCETTTAFAREIAAKASGLPVEFFKLAPRQMSRLVTRTVQAYLNAGEAAENNVLTLEKPYYYNGEEYREIDLSGIAELTSMNESAAENMIACEGFLVTETSFNYLYACCLAGMATGKPKEFFTGLPLKELLKLKNAVNDAGFFE